MIMNLDVLSASYNRHKSGELKTKHFTKDFRHIFRWLIRYYSKHKRAPKKTIQKVFEKQKKRINKSSQEIVGEYLNRLAEEFVRYEEDNLDPDYVRNEILPDFIREREISDRIEKIQANVDAGNFEEAENIIHTYPKITIEADDENLGTIIPFTNDDIEKGMSISKVSNEAFRFEGDLDKLIGPMSKGWLVAITGIEKSGKSFVLQEIGYLASMYQKKKVLGINLELSEWLVRNRGWHRISKNTNKRDAGIITYPVLDCENNQLGTCQRLTKMNKKKPLFRDMTENIVYQKRRKWDTCHYCRTVDTRANAIRQKRFVPTVWFQQEYIKSLTERRLKKAIEERKMWNMFNFRVKCFPRYSVNFDEARDYIMRYIDKTEWYPDIIMFDYLDILAPEPGNLQERIDVDRKWKKASKLAGELNCLVFNADQATKASRTQYALDQMSTSESKTKDSHLDIRISINQTDAEKALSISRVGILFHRHSGFDVRKEVIITQRLATSEAIMDNAILFDRGKKYRVTPL